jgi:hypothetical protein
MPERPPRVGRAMKACEISARQTVAEKKGAFEIINPDSSLRSE